MSVPCLTIKKHRNGEWTPNAYRIKQWSEIISRRFRQESLYEPEKEPVILACGYYNPLLEDEKKLKAEIKALTGLEPTWVPRARGLGKDPELKSRAHIDIWLGHNNLKE